MSQVMCCVLKDHVNKKCSTGSRKILVSCLMPCVWCFGICCFPGFSSAFRSTTVFIQRLKGLGSPSLYLAGIICIPCRCRSWWGFTLNNCCCFVVLINLYMSCVFTPAMYFPFSCLSHFWVLYYTIKLFVNIFQWGNVLIWLRSCWSCREVNSRGPCLQHCEAFTGSNFVPVFSGKFDIYTSV